MACSLLAWVACVDPSFCNWMWWSGLDRSIATPTAITALAVAYKYALRCMLCPIPYYIDGGGLQRIREQEMKQGKGYTYMNEQPLPSLCCSSAPLLCLLFVNVESTDSSNRQTMNRTTKKKCSQSVMRLCVCVFFTLFPCPDDPWTFLLLLFCMVYFPVCPASSFLASCTLFCASL